MKKKISIGGKRTYGEWLKELWTPERPFGVRYCRKKDRENRMSKKEFSILYKE